MNNNEFLSVFGAPQPHTQSRVVSSRLSEVPSGNALLAEFGAGSFCKGFISIASVREDLASLGGWQRWLPKKAYVYATTALGILYVADHDLMWLVNTHTGSILPTGYDLHEAVAKAASKSTRKNLLHFPLFQDWVDVHGPLKANEVLRPVLSLIKGGHLSIDTLESIDLASHLRSSRRLFSDDGRNAISIMPREDD